jgi:hypothetical protein
MIFDQNYSRQKIRKSLFLSCLKNVGKVKENDHTLYCPFKQHSYKKHESLELHGFETCHAEETGWPMLSCVVTQGFRLTNSVEITLDRSQLS